MKTLVWTRHSSHTLTLFRDPAVQRLLAALAGGLLVLSLTSTVRAQDTALAAARDLYAAARYDEALSALDELRGSQPLDARTERSVEQYRSLVLLALGREPEAEAAISNVITSDPLYRPDEMEVAPRVRAAFQEVRSRLLPEIVRDQYTSAKAAFDDRDFDLAGNRFTEVLSLLDEPELAGSLEDLRLLASGFLELSMAATAQAAAAEGESAPVPEDPPLPDPFRIYTIDHPGITPAEPIRQDVPRLPQ
jgi:tetratricopeptide (TPR) repeat protein